MALENNTQLNYTDKTTLKNYFKTGLKPTQAQFWATWDSYWHKSDFLPINSISGLGNLLDGKAETNHTHDVYATNDATSLSDENIISWQQALGVDDLDYVEIPTDDATSESHPYVVVIDNEGNSARRNATDFGKVDTIDGIEADENKDVKLGAVRKSEANEVVAEFDLHQKDGASIGIAAKGLQVSYGGITSTLGTESITVYNQVPDAAYQFQELLFPKRAVKATEEKVYPITYVQGVKASDTGRVDISGVGMNWTHASQRMSALVSKHNDATYNRLLGMDSNGNLNEVGLPALTNEMSKSTDAQKDAFRVASRKSTETYSIGQPRVDTILPPVIDNTKDYVQYVTLVGLNLFLNNSSPSTALVKIIRYKDIDNNLVPETIVDITNYQVYQTNTSILSFGIRYDSLLTGYYKVQVTHNGLINIGSSDILVTTQVTNNPIILDSWETYTPFEPNNLIVTNTSVKKTYGSIIKGSTVIEQQVKHFVIKQEDVLSGFRLNFVYKLTPAGTELGNVMARSSITFGLGYDQNINNTVVPDILISFIRGVLSLGLTSSMQPLSSLPLIYEIDLVVKNSLATVIVTLKNTGKVTTETFSFEQRNQQMYFYSTFLGSNSDTPAQIAGTTQELLFPTTYQSF